MRLLLILLLSGCTTAPQYVTPPQNCLEYRGRAIDMRNCRYVPECRLTSEDRLWLETYRIACEL
jgi:hypothetical protein